MTYAGTWYRGRRRNGSVKGRGAESPGVMRSPAGRPRQSPTVAARTPKFNESLRFDRFSLVSVGGRHRRLLPSGLEGAEDGAPFFVVADGHPALHADPDPLDGSISFPPEQFLEDRHSCLPVLQTSLTRGLLPGLPPGSLAAACLQSPGPFRILDTQSYCLLFNLLRPFFELRPSASCSTGLDAEVPQKVSEKAMS